MPNDFDPGYGTPPYSGLVTTYPDDTVYPRADFRVEWGPIFHRGRLDGSARVLLIGQDPSHNEAIVRRILVGEAGRRTQGFLAKLGMNLSYVMVNTFLYSVYGQAGGQKHAKDAAIAAYRNLWLDALVAGGNIEAVIALGGLADTAWKAYAKTPAGAHLSATYVHITHPTAPDSAAKNNPAKLAAGMKAMLKNWNTALQDLRAAIAHPDENVPLVPYGDMILPAEKPDIPRADFPPGLPDWMGNSDGWATRAGGTTAAKRRNITITVPANAVLDGGLPTEGANLTVTEKVIDPRPGSKLALTGRVVCMDVNSTVLKRGTIYVADGNIVAVQSQGPAPAGFENIAPLETRGTIYPGLIELHNHLSYNALRLWDIPRKYSNRNQWAQTEPAYRQLVSGPMGVIGKNSALLPALVRFVECKCLISGVTTSQGIALNSSAGIRKFYKGVIRTVERPDDIHLPAANTRIPDVAARDWVAFNKQLQKASCMLLHLSEGTDAAARKHFLALHNANQWSINPALCGIHCVALNADDLEIMQQNGGSMIWSPLSNLLLYGSTADVVTAKRIGLRMGIGSDWSPSGSKNLLCELKAAWLYSENNGAIFSAEEIIAMATRNAAAILKWDKVLGSIEVGKRADLLVIKGSTGEPYSSLISATEESIRLLLIHGVAQYGATSLMETLSSDDGESIKVGKTKFQLHLTSNDPDVPTISLADAQKDLRAALADLPNHIQTAALQSDRVRAAERGITAPAWTLELDELEDTGVELRPRLPIHSELSGSARPPVLRVPPVLQALELDGITVADDPSFLKTIAKEKNLPPYIATGLKKFYS